MEIIDDLNTEKWRSGDPNETTGFHNYRVMKCEKQDTPGSFMYAVFDDQGFLKKVLLHGGAGCRDPLTGISLIQLKLSPDEKSIHGIIVEDDCVTIKPEEEPEVVVPNGSDVTAPEAEGEAEEGKEKAEEEGVKVGECPDEGAGSENVSSENVEAENAGSENLGNENAETDNAETVAGETVEVENETGTETNANTTEGSETETKTEEATEDATTNNDDVTGDTKPAEEQST